jgi:hypothetical protein
MKIHVNRAGQPLGQFTPEELRAGFREGKFTGSDLAWRDGMASWRPLAEVIDELAPETEVAATPPVVRADGLPWERRAETGFWSGLFETIRLVLLEPSAAFGAMRQTGGFGAPLFFFVLLGTAGALAGIFYQKVFSSLDQTAPPEQQAMAAMISSTLAIGISIMTLPFVLAAWAFINAGMVHLALILVGGAKRPFEATFRVGCYAAGSTALLQLLPVCGTAVGWVWTLVLEIIGVSKVHGIGMGRAGLAVLLPLVVCCGLVSAVVLAAIVAVGGVAEFLQAIQEAAADAE